MADLWIAPAGTPPDTGNWLYLGKARIEGLEYEPDHLDDDILHVPPAGWSITLHARSVWTWYGYRVLTGRTHPRARRTKREYHRRRR